MKRRINTDEKGSITREFTAWCGRCQEWDQIPAPNMSDAVRSFKRDGRENSRKDGWVCPLMRVIASDNGPTDGCGETLARVERLDKEATPSCPWHVDSLRQLLRFGHKEEGPWSDCPDDMDLPRPEHADLIATYRTDAPALAAEVRRLQDEYNKLHSTLWARIDETREQMRVEELKRAAAQQELAMSKAAREELREEVERLREENETLAAEIRRLKGE